MGQRRRLLLILALAGTLLLVWFAPDDEVVPAGHSTKVIRGSSNSIPNSPGIAGVVSLPKTSMDVREVVAPVARNSAAEVVDIFASHSWYVAPPPPVPVKEVVAPPPVPTAPPLPFSYLGQVVDDDRVQVILTRGDRVITLHPGDKIDQNYRLESFSEGVLTFVYVPLASKQTLAVGGTP